MYLSLSLSLSISLSLSEDAVVGGYTVVAESATKAEQQP